MGFGNYKYFLYVALVSAAVLGFFIFYILWKRSVLRRVEGGRGTVPVRGSAAISRIREGLIILSVILFAFTALRPQLGYRMREVKNEGSDVLIALDVSPSMLAEDVKPSRLGRAKEAIKWIVNSLKGDRIGLILFSGDAFLQCPLTNDYGAFTMFLDGAGPDSIGLKGTDIGRAMDVAYRVFKKKRLTSRMMVLITDGEDHEGHAEKFAQEFRDKDISIYTVGVGKETGDVIPSSGDDSTPDSFYRDSSGKLIRTRKNSEFLKRMAGLTRGSYLDITNSFSGLRFILEIIDSQRKNEYGSRMVREPKEFYQIFVVFLVLLLSAELMLPERKRRL